MAIPKRSNLEIDKLQCNFKAQTESEIKLKRGLVIYIYRLHNFQVSHSLSELVQSKVFPSCKAI